MKQQTIKRTPTVQVGAFQEKVLFNKELFIAEQALDAVYTIEPVLELGTPEAFRPIVGSKVIYRLVGAGAGNLPIFDAAFNLDSQSTVIDDTLNAVNIVTMWYDGAEFWYSIANLAPVPIPPPAPGGVSRVGDFGYGPDIIAVNVIPINTNLIDIGNLAPLTPYAQVTAFDTIVSVHYTGTNTLNYNIRRSGEVPWESSNTDPKLCLLDYNCDDIGIQQYDVMVDDGVLFSTPVTAYIAITDDLLYCV